MVKITYWLSFFFLGYFITLSLYYLFLTVIGLFEGRKRARQHAVEDYSALSLSAFTIPLSIIIPAHNEEHWIRDSLMSVLNLDYPEFEVIVVDDGSMDKTPEILNELLDLKPITRSYLERFQCGKIQQIFKSNTYPQVTVISKSSGYKKAGAINTALNFAKYKYICVIDADTILEPDALLRVMAHVQKEPERIIGIGSYFGVINGFKIKDGKILERSFSHLPIIAYQNLEYIRSFIGNRVAWSRFNSMPIIAGCFEIWRRDIVLELGGFDANLSSEDVEFTFRCHEYIAKNADKRYKIIMLPYCVGWTEGPSNVRSLILQRNRWQRVINEAVFRYKHMICNPKYRGFAFLTLPYFVFYEVLGVFFELFSIALVSFGWLLGILNSQTFFAFLFLIILSNTLLSLLSILTFVRDQKLLKLEDIIYFIELSFLEFFWYRWIIIAAKLSGMYSYLRGVRAHDQYARVREKN